jgi:hypothetical protein
VFYVHSRHGLALWLKTDAKTVASPTTISTVHDSCALVDVCKSKHDLVDIWTRRREEKKRGGGGGGEEEKSPTNILFFNVLILKLLVFVEVMIETCWFS